MFSMAQITPGSLAILRAGRALFGTFRGDGAFVALATKAIIPVDADDVFSSRANVTSAMIRKGSSLMTGSTVSLAGLELQPKRTYIGFADAIRYASVFDDVSDADKEELISRVAEFYGIES